MDWLKTANDLVNLKKLADAGKEAKSLFDYAKKIDGLKPEKVSWGQIKFFDNKAMNKAIANAKEVLADARKIEKAKFDLPEFKTVELFIAAAKAQEKYGQDSKKYAAAVKKYAAELRRKDDLLGVLADELGQLRDKVADIGRQAALMRDYSVVLENAFRTAALVPDLNGTAQNAKFFALSQDAIEFRGIANDLVAVTGRIEKAAFENLKTVNQAIKDNQAWLKNAEAQMLKATIETLKKNLKLALPSW